MKKNLKVIQDKPVNSFIELDPLNKKINEELSEHAAIIARYFFENGDQPNDIIFKKEEYINGFESDEIPKDHRGPPVMIFDLDKTISDESVSPLFCELVKEVDNKVYVVTARRDTWTANWLEEHEMDNKDINEEIKYISEGINAFTGYCNDQQIEIQRFYCFNYVYYKLALELSKYLNTITFADIKLKQHLTEVFEENFIDYMPDMSENKKNATHFQFANTAGLIKMIQLLSIKSSLGCEWSDMWFFDDSSYNFYQWQLLSFFRPEVGELNFIGGEDKGVFIDKEKRNSKTYRRFCCEMKEPFEDCYEWAKEFKE